MWKENSYLISDRGRGECTEHSGGKTKTKTKNLHSARNENEQLCEGKFSEVKCALASECVFFSPPLSDDIAAVALMTMIMNYLS
jgi:hypothetical protein